MRGREPRRRAAALCSQPPGARRLAGRARLGRRRGVAARLPNKPRVCGVVRGRGAARLHRWPPNRQTGCELAGLPAAAPPQLLDATCLLGRASLGAWGGPNDGSALPGGHGSQLQCWLQACRRGRAGQPAGAPGLYDAPVAHAGAAAAAARRARPPRRGRGGGHVDMSMQLAAALQLRSSWLGHVMRLVGRVRTGECARPFTFTHCFPSAVWHSSSLVVGPLAALFGWLLEYCRPQMLACVGGLKQAHGRAGGWSARAAASCARLRCCTAAASAPRWAGLPAAPALCACVDNASPFLHPPPRRCVGALWRACSAVLLGSTARLLLASGAAGEAGWMSRSVRGPVRESATALD
jgi:hypothetical protein